MTSRIEQFREPPAEYRGKPFWAWNGKLDPAELRRQIRIMKKMGLGGFFMHSRVGLATEYLSDAWFACVQACIDEAKKQEMEAWLYDEDRWPSGAAGGLVTRDSRWRIRTLNLEELERVEALSEYEEDEVLGVWLATFCAEGQIRTVIPFSGADEVELAENQRLLLFRVYVHPTSDWYNGQSYLDTLNPEAVQRFIEVTHEAYRRRCGDAFGKTIPGIFTDEPNWSHGASRSYAGPWTGRLPEVFKQRYGYDLLPLLPHIAYDIDERSPQVRWHYYDCATWLFCDSFARQIGEWCERNNQLFTGHVLAEETLSSQTRVVGSAMRFYEHMQAPGMDLLTEYSREFHTAKQVSS
ncbi:MAG: hypothetical protein D6820_16420, partial [Lentisphaerae bacterium]